MASLSLSLKLKRPSRTDAVLAAAAVAVVVLAGYLGYTYRQTGAEVADAESRLNRSRINLNNARTNSNVEEEQANLAAAEAQLAAILSPPFDSGNVMLDIWQWAGRYDAQISSSTLAAVEETLGEQPYHVTNFSLVLTGGLTDLAAFISEVTGAPYRPVIKGAKATFSEERGDWALNMEMSLYKEVEA